MRFVVHFCENELVRKLLDEFNVRQGPLFHYTSQEAASGIRSGEIWLTRADCFLDSSEINHGCDVLSSAATATLSAQEILSFHRLIDILHDRLKSCYVMSLSQCDSNEHLRLNYASKGGAILRFEETFPEELVNGWHAVPMGNGRFSTHQLSDVYDPFEGFVVYDDTRKQQLAEIACGVFRQLYAADAHKADLHHFIAILIQCLVLFKEYYISPENEYRIALLRRRNITEDFEHRRDCRGATIIYVKVRIPDPVSDSIRIINQRNMKFS
jgi:hypothetical protein